MAVHIGLLPADALEMPEIPETPDRPDTRDIPPNDCLSACKDDGLVGSIGQALCFTIGSVIGIRKKLAGIVLPPNGDVTKRVCLSIPHKHYVCIVLMFIRIPN